MKKLIQFILLGYRENKQAKEAQGGSKLTFEGGSPQERVNAAISLQNEVLNRKFTDWNIKPINN